MLFEGKKIYLSNTTRADEEKDPALDNWIIASGSFDGNLTLYYPINDDEDENRQRSCLTEEVLTVEVGTIGDF